MTIIDQIKRRQILWIDHPQRKPNFVTSVRLDKPFFILAAIHSDSNFKMSVKVIDRP